MSWQHVRRDKLGRVINRIYARLPRIVPATKRCPSCKQIKPASEFHRDNRATSLLASQCKVCNNRTNREISKPKARQKLRDWLAAAKDVPCADCGAKFPAVCMDFDHVRGKKSFSVNTGRCAYSVQRLVEEIGKCEVVCSNCHRVRTWERSRRGRI